MNKYSQFLDAKTVGQLSTSVFSCFPQQKFLNINRVGS